MDSQWTPRSVRAQSSFSRRSFLGFAGSGAMALVLLQACSSAPATPTAVPPTPVPHPTEFIPTPTPVPQPTATSATQAAPTAAPTTAPTTAPTVAPTAASNATAQPAASLTFAMLDYIPFENIAKSVIQDFKTRQPSISVDLTIVPADQFKTKEKVQATAGTPFDITFNCCGDVPEFGELGLLLNLDPFVTTDKFDTSMYFAGSLWEGYFDPKTKFVGSGNLLALPSNFIMTYHVFNLDLLDKAKIDFPKWDWTWNDLLSITQKLTFDKNGKMPTDSGFDVTNVVQYGHQEPYWIFYDWIVAAGGRCVTPDLKVVVDSPEAIKGITFLADLVNKYHVMPPKQTSGPELQAFVTGKRFATVQSAMSDWANYRQNIKDFKWDVLPVPIGPIGKRIGYGGSNQFASWKGVKSPEAAWTFLKWICSPEMTLKYWATQGVPSVKASALSPDFAKNANLTPSMARLAAESGSYIQSEDPSIRHSQWWTALGAELDPVWEGKITPEQGAKNAAQKIRSILTQS